MKNNKIVTISANKDRLTRDYSTYVIKGTFMLKKHIAILLSLTILLGSLIVFPMTSSAQSTGDLADTGANVSLAETGYAIPSETTFANRLAQLKKKYYPNGYSGVYYEDGYAMAWQCYGFACQMLYDIFGIKYYASGFVNRADYSMGTIYAGDIIRTRGNTHSIFVTRVTSTGYYICDGNWDHNNGVRWDAFYTKAEMAETFTYKIHVPGNYLTGNAAAKVGLYAKTPALKSITCTGSGVEVGWNTVKEAAAYRVFCKVGDEKSWRSIAKTKSTSYTYNKNLVYGKKYSFTVRAVDAYGAFISNYNKTGISTNYRLAPPELKSVKSYVGRIRVTWAASRGVSLYRLYYKAASDKRWHFLANVKGTAYNFTKGKVYTTYRFALVCLNAKKQPISGSSASPMSARFMTYSTQLAIPTNVVPTPGPAQGTIKITWNAVPKATRYAVFMSKNGSASGWTKIGYSTKNYFIHKGRKNNTLYRYTVRCVDSKGKVLSGYKPGSALHYFDAPTKLKVVKKDNNGKVTFTWNKINKAAAYAVFYKTDTDKSWIRVKTAAPITNNYYVFGNCEDGKKYTFTVRVCTKTNKLLSYFSVNGASITYRLPAAPTEAPTDAPTDALIDEGTQAPTDAPNGDLTEAPTGSPTEPTSETTASVPTEEPTGAPVSEPSTTEPTQGLE